MLLSDSHEPFRCAMVSRLERMQSAVLWDGNGFWRRRTKWVHRVERGGHERRHEGPWIVKEAG